MSISSALNAGVMGLNVNSTRLAAISDNIANSSTYGYKRTEVDFSSMVINQDRSVYSAGGVRATSYKDVSSSGSIVSTGNALDITITGGTGMIPVTDVFGVDSTAAERDLMMVPTGGFAVDENGNMRTQSGLYLLGWPVDSGGVVASGSRDSSSSLVPVNVDLSQFSATPTRNMKLGVNLPAETTVAGGTGEAFPLPIEYFDGLGLAQELTFTFTPNVPATGSSNSWSVSVTDSAGNPAVSIADFSVDFDDGIGTLTGGSLAGVTPGAGLTYDAATGEITVNATSGPISVYVGEIGSNTGLTQLAAPFSPTNIIKDGAPIGSVRNVEINPQGMVEAVYNSGFRRTLFQVPVAEVPNPNGLIAIDNQAYQVSVDSGDLYFWDAGKGPVGDYAGYALMESNTDIAQELTQLIETQRAYSSNAKIIQTVDEMLQETTNLKR